MRIDRMEHASLYVNGQPGGKELNKFERLTLQEEVKEFDEMVEEAKNQPIKE